MASVSPIIDGPKIGSQVICESFIFKYIGDAVVVGIDFVIHVVAIPVDAGWYCGLKVAVVEVEKAVQNTNTHAFAADLVPGPNGIDAIAAIG